MAPSARVAARIRIGTRGVTDTPNIHPTLPFPTVVGIDFMIPGGDQSGETSSGTSASSLSPRP